MKNYIFNPINNKVPAGASAKGETITYQIKSKQKIILSVIQFNTLSFLIRDFLFTLPLQTKWESLYYY